MLSERPRNIMVGLTMLVSLAVLMYGIILLGKFPAFGALRPYEVTLMAPSANGITVGARVELSGVWAGQVTSVGLIKDAAGKMVARIVLQIDNHIDIPSNATAMLNKPQAVGNPFVSIEVPEGDSPLLSKDGKATLKALAGDAGLIPKSVFEDIHMLKGEISILTNQLTTVAKDLHLMLAYAPPEAVAAADPNDPNRVRENATTVVIRLNRTIKSIQDLLTDPALQGNVRQAIQNIADASVQLKSTLEKIEKVVTTADTTIVAVGGAATRASATLETTQAEVSRVSLKLMETLSTLEKSVRQISEGSGTTGKLINDPRLFDGLLDLSKSLKTTVDDLDFLVRKWKDEGLPLHLK